MKKRAFTLIEMLIVIAMMAILSAATMAILVGPLQERLVAEQEMDAAAGHSLAWSQFVQDMHGSQSLQHLGSEALLMQGPGRESEKRILWFLHANGSLRRHVLTPGSPDPNELITSVPAEGAPILPQVAEFSVVPQDERLWIVRIRSQSPVAHDGPFWQQTALVALGTSLPDQAFLGQGVTP